MRLLKMVFVFAILLLVACSADYDTFGTSDYRNMEDLRFEEQEDGNAALYTSEHKMLFDLVAPQDSQKTWDSVTIASIDLSHFSTMHLVTSKFKEFPSDSAGLDSIAKSLAYDENELHVGDKICLPASLKIYVMIVSESGLPALWQLSFTIPGVEPVAESSAEEAESSSSFIEGESSSSSEVVLRDDNSLSILFENSLNQYVEGDTIHVVFAQGTDLSKVTLESSEIDRYATIEPAVASISDWTKPVEFTVTAQNGETHKWVVSVESVKNTETDLQIRFENQEGVDRQNHGDTIYVYMPKGTVLTNLVVSEFSVSAGASYSSDPKGVKDWSKPMQVTVTAEDGVTQKIWMIKVVENNGSKTFSSEKELVSISAESQIASATIDTDEKKVVLHLASKSATVSVKLEFTVSSGASTSLISGATVDLQSSKKLVITAEDGSTVEWTIDADYPMSSEANILTFAVDDADIAVLLVDVDVAKRTVAIEVPFGTDLSFVMFKATYSSGAKKTSPSTSYLDLSSGEASITVTAEDGSTAVWTVSATEVAAAPEITALRVGEGKVECSIDNSAKKVFCNMNMATDLKLTNMKIVSMTLSEGATTSDIAVGSSYDLSRKKKVVLTNSSGVSAEYTVQAGYQYRGTDFNTWINDGNGNPYDVDGWDNGNNSATKELTVNESKQVVKMQTTKYSGKIASGNMLIAYFNPKNVALATMLEYDDGNELIDFGRPFYGRPEYIEFDVKYDGKSDSCDMYILLENRTRTADEGRNIGRTSSDVNTLVASAWYRTASVGDDKVLDPDVVSVTDASRSGYKTVRMKLKYGKPLSGSPIENSSTFSTKLKNASEGIDNHLVATESPDDFDVTHIRIVMASSALGNVYTGIEGATLWCDEIRLIY